ncbi:hypothetical protein LVD17_05820 [Fulvivirga ulvae]|uniref:hypothetical protein n=1 Tax=Fulvivirga ulvae TaxID=2904245 RepID=UPI001F48FE03|nr:hypothetical protein [Fulvivirga ulvae]UII33340.1 hypothetical protein LVD17_05820 [Fulvivirga ulvae]
MALYTNLSYLQDLTDDDEVLIAESLKRYLSSSPTQLNKLIESTENKQWDTIHDSAHSLFATTQIVGISQIAVPLKEIQTLARESKKDYNLIKSKVEYVAQVVRKSQEEVTKHLNNLGTDLS